MPNCTGHRTGHWDQVTNQTLHPGTDGLVEKSGEFLFALGKKCWKRNSLPGASCATYKRKVHLGQDLGLSVSNHPSHVEVPLPLLTLGA